MSYRCHCARCVPRRRLEAAARALAACVLMLLAATLFGLGLGNLLSASPTAGAFAPAPPPAAEGAPAP